MDFSKLPAKLLLGNDILSQFKKVTIDNEDDGPVLTLGALTVDDAAVDDRVIVDNDVVIPARSVKRVKIKLNTLEQGGLDCHLVTPSEQVMAKHGVSCGYTVVSKEKSAIMLMNAQTKAVLIPEGIIF